MNILEKIVARKRTQIPDFISKLEMISPRRRPHYSLMKNIAQNDHLSVIAEIKRGSPSLGLFAPNLNIEEQAKVYETQGASAISILTDEDFFGSSADLEQLAPQLQVPILAKDFIVHPSQIELANSYGADIILLIAAVLNPREIEMLANTAYTLGLDVILELHDIQELKDTELLPNTILGINNRNLKTFKVSLEPCLQQVTDLLQKGCPIIAESGIHTKEDAIQLALAGFSGLLIGESLIKSNNTGELLHQFSTIPKRRSAQ